MAKEKLDATSLFGAMQKINTSTEKKEIHEPDVESHVKNETVKVTEPEPKEIKVEDKAPEVYEETKINSSFSITIKKEKRRTVHKNFLITEELNTKFKGLAKQNNMNENELFNTILESMFK